MKKQTMKKQLELRLYVILGLLMTKSKSRKEYTLKNALKEIDKDNLSILEKKELRKYCIDNENTLFDLSNYN